MTAPLLGTCWYAWQPAEAEVVSVDDTGRNRGVHVETLPEGLYYCSFLSYGEERLPPPAARMAHLFEIRSGDCESCPHWEPADDGFLVGLWKKHRAKVKAKQKRLAKKREVG